MQIYDGVTKQPIESPDLEKGYLVDGTIITGYTTEVFPNTITAARPNGIKHRVPVYEDCQWYYPNSDSVPEEKTIDQKISDAVTAAVALAQGGAI